MLNPFDTEHLRPTITSTPGKHNTLTTHVICVCEMASMAGYSILPGCNLGFTLPSFNAREIDFLQMCKLTVLMNFKNPV